MRTDGGRLGCGKIVVAVAAVVCIVALGIGIWQSHSSDNDIAYRIVDEGTVVNESPRDAAAPFAANADGSYAREGSVAFGKTAALCGDRVLYLNHDSKEICTVRINGTDFQAIELPATAPDGSEGIPTIDSMVAFDGKVYVGCSYYVADGGWECVASMESDGSDLRILMAEECEYGSDTHMYVTIVGDVSEGKPDVSEGEPDVSEGQA
jgi:hypothetical protein